MSPCLTRSRAGGALCAETSPVPLFLNGSLQGLPRRATSHLADAARGGERAVPAALGDAMSLKNGSGERSVQRRLSR